VPIPNCYKHAPRPTVALPCPATQHPRLSGAGMDPEGWPVAHRRPQIVTADTRASPSTWRVESRGKWSPTYASLGECLQQHPAFLASCGAWFGEITMPFPPALGCGVVFGSFRAIATKSSFTFVDVLALVSMKKMPFSLA